MSDSISSNGVLSVFASDLGTVGRKFLKNFSERIEIVFFQEPGVLDGLMHIQKAKSRMKINLTVECLQLQKMTITSSESGVLSNLIVG